MRVGQALGRGRHLCGDRPGARADRLRAARPRARADLDADSPTRPPRRASERTRRPRRRSTSSRSRSATSRARKWREVQEPSARDRRARPRCGTSATPWSRSASAVLRGSCAKQRSGSKTLRYGMSATFALVGRARRITRRVSRGRLHARPLHLAGRGARRRAVALIHVSCESLRPASPAAHPGLRPRRRFAGGS